jgi:hypothetical protein
MRCVTTLDDWNSSENRPFGQFRRLARILPPEDIVTRKPLRSLPIRVFEFIEDLRNLWSRDMSKFIAILGAGVLGITLFSSNADAQWGHGSHGHGYSHGDYATPSHNYGGFGYSHGPQVHGYSNHNYGTGYGYGGYHNTSHYDNHAPSVYRHREYLHSQPGHYGVHRSRHGHH